MDATYRTLEQRALVGKSFGGSGVAHAILDDVASTVFHYFLLGSPSLAWDDKAFFRLEEESSKTRPPISAGVYAACGSKDQWAQKLGLGFRV